MTYSIIYTILEGLEDEFKSSNNVIMAQWLHSLSGKKISFNYAQKDRDPLFSSSPKNNDIKDADRSLSCKEGCPSLLGRSISAAVCLSIQPLCHLYHIFSVCHAFKCLLLAEARDPYACRAVQTLGETMAPLKFLGVLALISAENFSLPELTEQRKGTVLVVTLWRPLLTTSCKVSAWPLGNF